MPSATRFVQLLTGVLAALSCWWMTWMLWRTWMTPLAVEEGRWVSLGVGIMVMEFILVHSGGMLAALTQAGRAPLVALFFLALVYALFGLTIAFAFESRLLLYTFVAIMLPRFIGAMNATAAAGAARKERAAISALLYLGVAFLSVFVSFPDGGLSHAVLEQVYPDRGEGIWERNPQQALAAGMLYFGLLGLYEIGAMFHPTEAQAAAKD